MTVKREITESFEIPTQEISGYIETILCKKEKFYSYTKTTKSANDCFETVIKPIGWPFVLSTKMIICFSQGGNTTDVVVKTISQKWVFHDSLNTYNRYIYRFLDCLREYS